MPDLTLFPPEVRDNPVFVAPLVRRCICAAYPDAPCVAPFTGSEDGLCDTCRDGCTRITLTCQGRIRHHSHTTTPAWVFD